MEKTQTQHRPPKSDKLLRSKISQSRQPETRKDLENDTKSTFPINFSPDRDPSESPIHSLQRTVGNQAAQRLIQAKLTIGRPYDEYEREADQVADTVMSIPDPQQGEEESPELQTKPTIPNITPLVMRQPDEEEEMLMQPLVQGQGDELEEEDEAIQTRPDFVQCLCPECEEKMQRQPEDEGETVQGKPVAIQRLCSECEKKVQRQSEAEEEDEGVQARAIVQRQENEEEEALQPKSLLQLQAEAEEENKTVQASGVISRQEADEEDETAQAKSLLQRQQEEDEEAVQAKPAIQTQQEETEEDELIHSKPAVQREVEEEEETAQMLRRQPEKEEDLGRTRSLVQRQAGEEDEEIAQAKPDSNMVIQCKTASVSANIRNPGAGSPLSPNVRSRVEPVLGVDLGHVRVHTDSRAQESACALQAKAFTNRNHIWMGANQSPEDISLMAHEATHVVQQSGEMGESSTNKPKLVESTKVNQSCQRRNDCENHIAKAGLQLEEDANAKLESDLVFKIRRQENDEDESEQIESQVNRHLAGVENQVLRAPDPVKEEIKEAHRKPEAGTTHTAASDIQKPDGGLSEAVDTIIDALEGYTSLWDSENIVQQFQGKSAATISNILTELKSRASAFGKTRDGMVDWMFDDMTAEDARTLRRLMIESRISDVNRIVAIEVEDLLSGATSSSDSREIVGLLSQFSGNVLDDVLGRLERLTEKSATDLADWLFVDLNSVDTERLRVHMLTFGGARSMMEYAAWYTADKIESLLAGYTSHADSSSIVSNFERTPGPARSMVLYQLDQKTRERWSENAEDALMKDMDRSDYERLAAMEGLTLRAYDYERSWLEGFISGAEYVVVAVEYLVCGLVGIITGLLSVVWDIIVLIWDLLVAVYSILGMILYFATGGAAGSEEWLAVKDFFRGLGQLFGHPGQVIEAAWNELVLEATLIEGPFENCREAEFWVRKTVNLIVNILLIFAAGYGAVKGGASAVKTIVQTLRASGFRKGLVELGAMVLKGTGTVFTTLGDEFVRVLRALKTPTEILRVVRFRLNNIKFAAADESYWQFLRRQAGARVAAEREFWEEFRNSWSRSAEIHEGRVNQLEDGVRGLMDDIEDNKLPGNADEIIDDVQRGSNSLKDDVDDLHDQVVKDAPEPLGGDAARIDQLSIDPQTGKSNPKSISEAQTILQAEREGLVQNARRPDLARGDPNLDFVIDGGYAEVKTPIDRSKRSLPQQATDMAYKINIYQPDVRVVVDLKNLSTSQKTEFLQELQNAGVNLSRVDIVNR